MGKLTHLEAFMSDDAKRGRVWTDSEFLTEYRRLRDVLQCRVPGQNNLWFNSESQVVTKLGDCRWADEPKTLTPQEALRALADGKVLIDKDLLWKLGGDGCIYTKHGSAPWEECPSQSFNDWHVVPDPSQPAEPARPPLKVGDRVKDTRVRSRSGTVVGPCNDDRLVKVNYDDIGVINGSQVEYLEKIEAEPQVEYPKSSCSCMGDASCPCRRNK